MIRLAKREDMENVINLVKHSHKKYDGRMFLDGVMNAPIVYVKDDGNSINSVAYVVSKVINLHNKRVKVSYINATTMSGDDLGRLVRQLSHHDIMTLVQSDNPQDLEGLGFESVIEMSEYNLNADMIPKLSVEGIVLDPRPEKLLEVYDQFTRHFTGFFERNAAYYQGIRRILGNQGGIIGYEENGKMLGYIVYEAYENVVIVKEACYLKSGHLLKMLAFVARGKGRIVVNTSPYEHLSKIFPTAKKTKRSFIMAVINDKPLFEQLFHIKIISAYSGFNAFGKALWNRDYF